MFEMQEVQQCIKTNRGSAIPSGKDRGNQIRKLICNVVTDSSECNEVK